MPDREKVIREFGNWCEAMADECPIICLRVRDLIEEQEAVVPINSYGTFRCGNCRNIVGYKDSHWRGYQNNFCSKCGKAVKWDA